MKGFVAAVLASVATFQARPLARPIHLAFSYDEEAGCVGVRHLIARLPSLCAPPEGCIVGEPTGMRPVLRHKGKAAVRVTVHGRAAHSARPDLGLNAIHAAADLVVAVRERAAELAAKGPFNRQFEPPSSTLQVGVIAGGSALNIVPERCLLDIEARAIPGSDPATLLAVLDRPGARLEATGFRIETETLGGYPSLDLADDHPLAGLAEEVAGHSRAGAVSFGTEAGLYQQAGIPAVVCGPGDIARAHRADEYVLRGELAETMQALERLAHRLAA
jgi:acetylornithine deacetylase